MEAFTCEFLSEHYTPCNTEISDHELMVEGDIPHNLNGVLYRIGPNPRFKPKGQYHLFDGDGMVHAFYFQRGSVKYRNRWIRTERFEAEERFQQAVFPGILDSSSKPLGFTALNRANTANTNLIWHANKLLALWEFGTPYEIHPDNLTTIGKWWLVRDYKGAFTAHPKHDPVTNNLIAISYNGCQSLSPCILTIISPEGNIINSTSISVPYRGMLHDFIMTENFIVLPLFPAIIDFSGQAQGVVNWHPDKFTCIGIIPRQGNEIKISEIRWFSLEACYVYHFVNAYEKDDLVIVDLIFHEHAPLFVFDKQKQLLPTRVAQFKRWKFDMVSQLVSETELDSIDMLYHFPSIDQRFLFKNYCHMFASGENTKKQFVLIHNDLKIKQKFQYCHGDNWVLGEPVFIANDKGYSEGDGYLLSVATNKTIQNSELLIFNAKEIEQGPIGTIFIPQHIPSGFHGCWINRRL